MTSPLEIHVPSAEGGRPRVAPGRVVDEELEPVAEALDGCRGRERLVGRVREDDETEPCARAGEPEQRRRDPLRGGARAAREVDDDHAVGAAREDGGARWPDVRPQDEGREHRDEGSGKASPEQPRSPRLRAQCGGVGRPAATSRSGAHARRAGRRHRRRSRRPPPRGARSPAHRRAHSSRQVGDRLGLWILRRPGEDAALRAQRLVERLELARELLEGPAAAARVAVRGGGGQLLEDRVERPEARVTTRSRRRARRDRPAVRPRGRAAWRTRAAHSPSLSAAAGSASANAARDQHGRTGAGGRRARCACGRVAPARRS